MLVKKRRKNCIFHDSDGNGQGEVHSGTIRRVIKAIKLSGMSYGGGDMGY